MLTSSNAKTGPYGMPDNPTNGVKSIPEKLTEDYLPLE
jgi:hypothetical protein